VQGRLGLAVVGAGVRRVGRGRRAAFEVEMQLHLDEDAAGAPDCTAAGRSQSAEPHPILHFARLQCAYGASNRSAQVLSGFAWNRPYAPVTVTCPLPVALAGRSALSFSLGNRDGGWTSFPVRMHRQAGTRGRTVFWLANKDDYI